MNEKNAITALFLDIGGVLLTDGWNRKCRKKAAEFFALDLEELEERHHLTFDTYEAGKLSLHEYLNRIVFYEKRSFTRDQFQQFMFDQSKPFPKMIEMIRMLKKQYNLKVAVISNEGRELTEYRIKQFRLNEFVDFFISSCFVHFRKPDADIFRVALDIAQVPVEEMLYIEDRPMFVMVAESQGIKSIHHTDYETTRAKLESFGLVMKQ